MAHVLVAEDNVAIQELIVATLAHAHHHATAVGDGAAAMAILNRGVDVDVVVTDYTMPGADGIEVIRHAQRVDPTLPCIIVTATHDLDLATRGMQAGAIGFIPKPFKPDHLLATVGQALRRRELAAEVARQRVLMPMLERFTMVLANTIESKDLSTGQHSERLALMADAVAARMEMPLHDRALLRLGAALHDIGKVAVPEVVLNKVEPLEDQEVALLRTHPDVGAAILTGTGVPEAVRAIIRHHHERFDGTGYPGGLRGAAIPLGARIVGAVDAADVMLHGRAYSPAKSVDQVIHELIAERARHFDPDVVSTLVDYLADDLPNTAA